MFITPPLGETTPGAYKTIHGQMIFNTILLPAFYGPDVSSLRRLFWGTPLTLRTSEQCFTAKHAVGAVFAVAVAHEMRSHCHPKVIASYRLDYNNW